jgi:hypothetical protein
VEKRNEIERTHAATLHSTFDLEDSSLSTAITKMFRKASSNEAATLHKNW